MLTTIIDMPATGRNIERLLREKGLTVIELTGHLGLATTNAVYKWLRGETLPSLDNLVLLSVVLNVAMDDIIIVNSRDLP